MVFIPNTVMGVMMAILPVTSFSPGIFAKVKVGYRSMFRAPDTLGRDLHPISVTRIKHE